MGMTPAKSRERKCSTCKHYQPSPLWRKGWCRNPLLYDRNTNHLVEGESLACNRTFIDYWEPLENPAAPGPLARTGKEKPRVAPSIPMSPVDARGNPVQGRSGGSGSAAVAPAQVLALETTREKPPLSLVQRSSDDNAYGDPKHTLEIDQINAEEEEPAPGTTRQRIRAARAQSKPSTGLAARIPLNRLRNLRGVQLWVPLGLLIALLVLGGGGYLLTHRGKTPAVVATAVPTHPLPTPTGFGDATATLPPPPTVARPVVVVPSVIAASSYVLVSGSKSGLTLRSTPSKSGTRLRVLPDGTKARVIDGPKDADGYTWWKIDSFDAAQPSLSGWCASIFLVPTSPPAP